MKKIAIMSMVVLLLVGVATFAGPNLISAQAQVVPEVPDPTGGAGGSSTKGTVSGVFSSIADVLVAVAIGVAVIAIIWGAIAYMTAGGDPEKAKSARTILINGLIGAVILFALSFLIGLAFNVSEDVIRGS